LLNANTGGWLTNATVNSQLKTVLGESGRLFFSIGAFRSNGDAQPVSTGLWCSCSAMSGTTTTDRVNGFFEVRAFGFGMPKPGSTYASEWVSGWYDAGNMHANAVFGTWKSTDDPNHGATGACNVSGGAQTWTNIRSLSSRVVLSFNRLSGDP
jgi:hypothetical protein